MENLIEIIKLIESVNPECAKRLAEAILEAAMLLHECATADYVDDEEEDFPAIPGRPVVYSYSLEN